MIVVHGSTFVLSAHFVHTRAGNAFRLFPEVSARQSGPLGFSRWYSEHQPAETSFASSKFALPCQALIYKKSLKERRALNSAPFSTVKLLTLHFVVFRGTGVADDPILSMLKGRFSDPALKVLFLITFHWIIMLRHHLSLIVLLVFAVAPVRANETVDNTFSLLLDGLPARSVGPANMSGRITDLAVVERDTKTIYAATASGGVWKSVDGGTRWNPVFDQENTLCIGSVAVCQGKPDVVYVGSGEANPRNSVSWGNGVYKSVDAGKTWKHVGLTESHHIGRIVIHPANPDIVYVAALGHLWGPNKERGIYKTTDGGKTWNASKYLDENTGFIDLAMDPENSDILYATAYPVRRDPYSGGAPRTQWGPLGGLYKTTDGGKTWDKLTQGLPNRPYGRCGVSISRKNPKLVYAVIQTDLTDGPTDNVGQRAKSNEGDVDKGGIFRSEDQGKTWKKVNNLVPRPFYYGQIRIDPRDENQIYVLGVGFHVSSDGGKTFTTPRMNVHPDHHALWIDPGNSDKILLGNDGGVYRTSDRGKTWEALRSIPVGQFYAVAVDQRTPYRIYGGLQDNGSWGGPVSTNREIGITLADWRRVGSGDGFRAAVDPTDNDTIYVESQYGRLVRVNLKGPKGPVNKSIIPVAPKGEAPFRFNWNTPYIISPHQPQTLYFGANRVFKSTSRGDKWEIISPDLTRGQENVRTSGHTLTSIAESPFRAGTLMAGTDDGRLHLTQDDGKTWQDLSEKLLGPKLSYTVTGIEWSTFVEGTVYVSVIRYRLNDYRPYLFKSVDNGQTWTSLAKGLPEDAAVQVIRESSRNRKLLFAGTERGLFASIDGGKKWHSVKNGIPATVPVHDLVIHPRERELVIGTHGRSVYVMDIAPLESFAENLRTASTHFFHVKPARAIEREKSDPPAQTEYIAPNPPVGAIFRYLIANKTAGVVKVFVTDSKGRELATWSRPANIGLNTLVWDLRDPSRKVLVSPGEYLVTLIAGDEKQTRTFKVEASATTE
jgi:photosystem II stability/assembly factor-like uncharacterized protein